MAEIPDAELVALLGKAHAVVTWTTQDTMRRDVPRARWLTEARQEYLKARIDAYANVRPLAVRDILGCTCPAGCRHVPDLERCMYHYAASRQPWNHRIPWNCPTYYDGCNCDGGPFYEMPPTTGEAVRG